MAAKFVDNMLICSDCLSVNRFGGIAHSTCDTFKLGTPGWQSQAVVFIDRSVGLSSVCNTYVSAAIDDDIDGEIDWTSMQQTGVSSQCMKEVDGDPLEIVWILDDCNDLAPRRSINVKPSLDNNSNRFNHFHHIGPSGS